MGRKSSIKKTRTLETRRKCDMKKWIVVAEVTISMHTVVEANTEEEAKEKAERASMMRLCHQCSEGCERSTHRGVENEWRTSGELDGEPKIIGAEEA